MTLNLADRIGSAEADAYARDGVVCLRGVISQTWIEQMRAAATCAMANPGPHAEQYEATDDGGRFFGDLDVWQREPVFERFMRDGPAAEIAGRVMGSAQTNFFYDQLLVKEPGAAARTPWHQDQPYWAVKGREVCSVWIPMDEVARETNLEFVRGSHDWPEYNPRHFIDDTPYADTGLPELPDIEADRAAYDIFSCEIEPGDCFVFNGMTVHGAGGNASTTTRRRALTLRWTGDDVRFWRGAGEVGYPVTDPGLSNGDKMTCAAYPLIWQRSPETVET